MTKKGFKNPAIMQFISNDAQYTHEAKEVQEVQEVQGVHQTHEVQEVHVIQQEQYKQEVQDIQEVQYTPGVQDVPISRTQGRKGQKLPRINMAFSPQNHEYLQLISRLEGVSITEYVNRLIETDRGLRAEVIAKAKQILSIKGADR
jgi:hypothetical protein